MSALAEMERELIVERTRAGLATSRTEGRIGVHGVVTFTINSVRERGGVV